jgi:hypothetical protein
MLRYSPSIPSFLTAFICNPFFKNCMKDKKRRCGRGIRK